MKVTASTSCMALPIGAEYVRCCASFLQWAEAMCQVQAKIEGLLHRGQGWRPSCSEGQNGLTLVPTPLAGTPVACGTSSKGVQVLDEESPNKRRR